MRQFVSITQTIAAAKQNKPNTVTLSDAVSSNETRCHLGTPIATQVRAASTLVEEDDGESKSVGQDVGKMNRLCMLTISVSSYIVST